VPDQPRDLAGLDDEIEAVERAARAVSLLQPLQFVIYIV